MNQFRFRSIALLTGVMTACLGFALSDARAGGGYDFTFDSIPNTHTEDGFWPIEDGGAVIGIPLFMDDTVPFIQSIELVIRGLTHDHPADLDIVLFNPFGTRIEIMTDLGDSLSISNVDLTFNDLGTGIPGEPITTGTYQPEGLWNGTDGGFTEYVTKSGGTNAWLLVVGDDSAGQSGMLEGYTLRGTVPEPATLSLLAIGGLAALRRRRFK